MCLLKNKIMKVQALKKPTDLQGAAPVQTEAAPEMRKAAPKEDINSLKAALTAFTTGKVEIQESHSPSNMSASTDHECCSTGKPQKTCPPAARKAAAAAAKKKEAKEAKETKEVEKGHNGSPTKNIAINFGKAMASFALSHIAIPYIMDYIEGSDLTLQDFFVFVKKNKKCIKSMQGLRSLLLVLEGDDKATAGYKRVFQRICELFVKNYSVNWIVHSKLSYKLVYLKWRFKMLRRIRNPELFTHIC